MNEGGTLEIAAPAGKKLVITKAVYGPAGRFGPRARTMPPSIPAGVLATLPGFEVELVLKADPKTNGSWICLANDPQGRLLLGGQGGQPITRVTLQDGKCVKQELLNLGVSETMGMLFVGDALYINGSGKRGFGLYRCKDTKGDGGYDDVELLGEWPGGSGEHGSHGLVLGPDKMLYTVCGNFTNVPKDLAASSPHRNYADDWCLTAWKTETVSAPVPNRRAATSPGWISKARTSNCFLPASETLTTSASMPTANCSVSTATWSGTGEPRGTGRFTFSMPSAAASMDFAKGARSGPTTTPTVCRARRRSASAARRASFSAPAQSFRRSTRRRFTFAIGPMAG